MPLSEASLAAIERYWAGFFGCPAAELGRPGTRILPHAELEQYRGIFCLRRGEATVASVPPDRLDHWRERLAPLGAAALMDPAALARAAGVGPAQVIGPASVAYADATSLRPLPVAGTRPLTAADEAAHAALAAACSPEEWAHGGSELGLLPLVGRFARDELVALAGYELWGEQIAHIYIITHPARRGRGYGAEAVSLLAELAIARGLIAQYRTLVANTPSLRLGASLGFAPFAETLAARLGPAGAA